MAAKTRSTTSRPKRPKIPFKYCIRDVDCRDNERIYLRIPKRLKYRMQTAPFDENGCVTQAFAEEYHRVLTDATQPKPELPEWAPGSVGWLIDQYYKSKTFRTQSPLTQRDKRSVFNRYMDIAGPLPFKKIRKSDVERSQLRRIGTPGAADKLVKYLKALFNWAISEGIADGNPAHGVSKVTSSDGFHTWSEREITHFRAHYPLGTRARLALELMLNLGVRRSDLVNLGPANCVGGRIEFTPRKGSGRQNQKSLSLPIMPELAEALAASAPHGKTFLLTDAGQPFTANGFGNRMRKWCDEVGLAQCSAHGLRKRSATLLAEAGASELQLMAIFGWSDPKMARHYTEAARAKLMIDAGFDHLAHRKVPLSPTVQPSGTNGEDNAYFSMPIGKGGRPGGTRTPNQTVMSGRL